MKTYPIAYIAMVNILNFVLYISIPIIVRYAILKKPLQNKWLIVSILLPIFVGFSIVAYRIASSKIMCSYLNAINDAAITATAHKLARLVYSVLKYGTDYADVGQEYYEQRYKSRVIQTLKKRAQQLGYELVETMMVNKQVIVTQIQ